jgi:hypothetical protein
MKNWDAAKRKRRIGRKHRRDRAAAILPIVKALCERYVIQMSSNDHGYQFRKAEYVVLWNPGTNKVNIQYTLPGHGDTVQFRPDPRRARSEPKIVEALFRLIEVTR